ncbi:MAG: c-type cytochrome [Planctomycetia bacterium]|nr:c-type cytochrome [Planctomycetia bacterium]
MAVLLAGIALCAIGVSTARGEEIQPATDRPQPKSPEESARCAKLPPGFRLDLVAAEPLVREPTAMAFDGRGRIFVCEIHGYNLDGYLDIIELNKTGKLDREVRRVRHATPESQEAAKKETYGTVKLLRDTDGDGRMDVADVWADRLPPCYGVTPARGGVIVICAPDIIYLADRDGDGIAEVRETLFTGFAREYIERGINSPRLGPDNWIYCAAGGGGGTITGPKLARPVKIGHTDFRFKPDGSAIEPVTGRESMFGLAMTDFGDRFHTIMTYVIPIPDRYLARNPYVQSPAAEIGIIPSRQLFPISQPDPWRKARGQDPAWVQFYGAAETQPNGQFTASSGQTIYRADAFPAEYRGNYFVCDPANNLIHRSLLERRGAEYVARRPAENENSEFVASTDQWFRPMNLGVGPDGALYIVDMYREIVEDFSAIPRFLQQQYAESLIAGKDHGRLWRLSWQAGPAAARGAVPVRLNSATPGELVKHLDHPNPWWRETAQRLLVERQDVSVRPALANLVRQAKTTQGRMHALYTLEGLSRLEPADVVQALADTSDGVRVHALQLAERWLDSDPPVLEKVLTLGNDADPRVRVQLALTLGQSRDERAIAALARLAAGHGDELWMPAAIISSVAQNADAFLARLLSAGPSSAGTQAVLGLVGETIGAQRNAAAVGRCLQQTADLTGADAARQQLVLLNGLVRGLGRGKPRALPSEPVARGLERLLASPSAEVSERAVQIAGLLQLKDSPAMQAAWETASNVARDGGRPLASRLAAVTLLAVAPWERQQSLQELLDARQPGELQLAAVKALGNGDHPDVAAALLKNWTGLGPRVQESIVDSFFARQDRLPLFLDAVERDAVPAFTISALRREQLLEHGNAEHRKRARQLLAGRANDDRGAVVAKYASALTLPRDPRRGEAVYVKTCARCHRLGEQGLEVGPDLLAVRTRPDETLLADILDPSGALARGYTVYAIVTTDGRVHTGILAGEAATSVTLRNAAEPTPKNEKPAVVEDTILRRDIDEMRTLSKSLMPEGLEKELTPQNVADLLGFLRHSLGPVVSPGVVLFDDEPEFVAALKEGAARASLSTADKHAGAAALLVTAGQRYSPRITGWEYRIVENPAGEPAGAAGKAANQTRPPNGFRYLRFAWKSAGAKGVMIELAAQGAWPPADRPLRRYFSGENSSGWQAIRVAEDVPVEWTVVTVDLWKDFGDFTLTGIAPTALDGPALFDKIELLQSLPDRPSLDVRRK